MLDTSVFVANPNKTTHLIQRRDNPPSTWVKVLAMLILFPLGITSLAAAVIPYWNTIRLKTVGQTTSALVRDMRIHATPGSDPANQGGTFYEITYSYKIDEWPYRGQQDVEKSYYDNTHIGAIIPVLYLSIHPMISEIKGQGIEIASRLPQILALGGFGLLFMLVSLNGLSSNWKPIPTMRKGQIAQGHIVKARGETKDNAYWLEIEYKYTNPSGVTSSSIDRIQRDDLQGWLPEADTPVQVLWRNEKTCHLL